MVSPSAPYYPQRGVFEVTLKCNLRCAHCGSSAGVARENELSTDECAGVFDQLGRLGMRWLTISGGEPTTRKDWPDLIRLARGAGIRVGMITNGLGFNGDSARVAVDAGLCGLGLSLDGIGATHDRVRGRIGHFNQVVEAMGACIGAKLPFAVVTHVNKSNINELQEIHDLVFARGAYAWQVQPGTDMGNMHHHPELQLAPSDIVTIEHAVGSIIKKSRNRIHPSDSLGYFGPNEKLLRRANGVGCFGGCPAGLRVIGIESNGNVKGCLSIMPGYNERSHEFVEGNVRQESLADIWNREGGFAYNRRWSLQDLGGFCAECGYATTCRGGCMAKKVASGGGRENPMCAYRVTVEQDQSMRRSGRAAAVVLASLLGAAAQGCHHVQENPSDAGADSETFADAYGIPEDTDTGISPAYGIPDTETTGDDYGMPDTETGVDAYGIPPDTDTVGGDYYGMPSQPKDD